MSRSLAEKELIGHTPRGSASAGGGFLIVFSLPFMGIGVLAALRGLNVITFGKVNAPPQILVAVGAVFGLAGLLLFISGVRALLKKAQLSRVQSLYPHEPWRGDHPWNPQETRDNTLGRAGSFFLGAAFMCLFLTPFNWWGFISKDGNAFVIAIVGVFDLITLLILGQGVYLFFRAMKYGKSILHFERFPYFLGEGFEARLVTGRPIGEFSKVSITLQCVQERIEVRGSGKNRSQQIVAYSLFSETLEINQSGVQEASAGLPISFTLPDQPRLATRLLDAPPQLQYWELEVAIETPGIDYGATFLLPIYAKAGALTAVG